MSHRRNQRNEVEEEAVDIKAVFGGRFCEWVAGKIKRFNYRNGWRSSEVQEEALDITRVFGEAQNSPEDYLEAHNTARAKVKVKPLKWDWRLESYAYLHLSQKTEHCIPIQSDGPYGENTESGVTATGAFRKLTGAQAVGVWVAQKQYYDEKSNSCIGGYCRHYMQVVWRDTTHIGCARVQCEVGAYMVSCNYSPPGNLLDQRPY
ncbi:pathogenesis-related protein 1B-like [Arachis ipaensis]|uniref:pathogenesis-related protein 1B-like n=1 Tax=Arachis ipaensis TaxID=130454 RepID=UPI0007AF150F|nr:pathogenesis-related protein 1B-like [Arachis ipaensis]XP_025684602.1 pathogenesis-related protein 1B-like [Arachis hypogaea]